jgi:O-methyltransferase involved in polyketide biosynthesis
LLRDVPNLRLYDVDFSDVISKRVEIISNPEFLEMAESTESYVTTDYGYQFNSLHLVSGDLRIPDALISKLLQAGLDQSSPVLVITECVFACK